jgi:tight adherence protein B
MDTTLLVLRVLLFLAVVLALEGLYHLWSTNYSAEAKRLADRIRNLEGGLHVASRPSLQRRQELSWLDSLAERALARLPGGARLLRYVQTAGSSRGAGELLVLSATMAAIGTVVPMVLGLPRTFVVLGGCVPAVLPWIWLTRQYGRRVRHLERQLPEALDLMTRALRAGHALPTAIKMVGEEMPEPIAREFRQLFEEVNLGMPQNEALLRLADRLPLEDVRYFVIAVMIQRESGGNLAELIDNIASLVRARLKLLGHVRTLSAEGRMSAWVLGLLPFALALVINLVNPGFLQILWTDPLGLKLVGAALVMMVLGTWCMRKIIRIRI